MCPIGHRVCPRSIPRCASSMRPLRSLRPISGMRSPYPSWHDRQGELASLPTKCHSFWGALGETKRVSFIKASDASITGINLLATGQTSLALICLFSIVLLSKIALRTRTVVQCFGLCLSKSLVIDEISLNYSVELNHSKLGMCYKHVTIRQCHTP